MDEKQFPSSSKILRIDISNAANLTQKQSPAVAQVTSTEVRDEVTIINQRKGRNGSLWNGAIYSQLGIQRKW